jgi:hypothetical protein
MKKEKSSAEPWKTASSTVEYGGVKYDMVEMFLAAEKKGDGVWAEQKKRG